MDALQAQLNEINDALVLKLVTQMAKPTVTLTQLRAEACKSMEELELRGALGRLWRSVVIYRHGLTGGVVLYWPEERLRAVVTSGIIPDMPEGVPLPDCVQAKPREELAKEFKKQEFKEEVKEEKLTRHEENQRKSRWQLVPISQTAALPMRPLPEGQMGSCRRSGVVAEVASAMFRYRDVRLSIDAVASLVPHHTRTDVARVISQTVNGAGKKYFVRFNGETRFDHTYQWNHAFSYPFPERNPDDGARVQLRNVDPEVVDDEVLDHLQPEHLTEDETESEIARLIGNAVPAITNEDKEGVEEVVGSLIDAGIEVTGVACVQEEDDSKTVMIDFKPVPPVDQIHIGSIGPIYDGPEGPKGPDDSALANQGYNFGFPPAEKEPVDNVVRVNGVAVGMRGENGIPGCGNAFESDVTVNDQKTGHARADDSPSISVMPIASGVRRITGTDAKFRAALFDSGELVLHFENSQIELTPEQTDKVMSLLGPQFLARMKKVA